MRRKYLWEAPSPLSPAALPRTKTRSPLLLVHVFYFLPSPPPPPSCLQKSIKILQVTTGHLVNLATTDVERFQYGGTFVSYLWEAPVEALVILYLGLQQVGVSFLAGFAALALLVPLQVRKTLTSALNAFETGNPFIETISWNYCWKGLRRVLR